MSLGSACGWPCTALDLPMGAPPPRCSCTGFRRRRWPGELRAVLAPDLKGLGASEIQAPYDVATLTAELAALVLHEVDGPVDVVGHDWGGVLAIALAAGRPELVRRLVVLSAPYRRVDLLRAPSVAVFALPVLPELVLRIAGRWAAPAMLRRGWRAEARPDPAAWQAYATAYAVA